MYNRSYIPGDFSLKYQSNFQLIYLICILPDEAKSSKNVGSFKDKMCNLINDYWSRIKTRILVGSLEKVEIKKYTYIMEPELFSKNKRESVAGDAL